MNSAKNTKHPKTCNRFYAQERVISIWVKSLGEWYILGKDLIDH